MTLYNDFKYIKIVNLQQHKGVVVEDSIGIPRFTMGPLGFDKHDLKDVQLNSGFIDQALVLLRKRLIKVFLDSVELSDTDLASLKYIDTASFLSGYLKRSPNDFTTFSGKSSPDLDDVILIEDSADGYSKKQVKYSDLSGSHRPLVVDFAWSDVISGFVPLGFCPAGGIIPEVVMSVSSAFNGGLQITVGDAVAQGRLMVVKDNDPEMVANYKNDVDYEYTAHTELFVFFPSGTPTTGNGRVIVYLE